MVQVGASLRGEHSGRPLVGKRVRFLAGRAVICESVTDRSGHASCGGVAPNGRTVAENGYEVVFEGDRWYRAARARTE